MSDSVAIPLLARALGGLLPAQAYLFHGGRGVGKTVLGLQVAHAWLKSGRGVAYLSRTRVPDLLDHAAALGFDLTPEWRSGQLALCEFLPDAARQFGESGAGPLLDRLQELCKGEEISALVVDPLDALFRRRGGADLAHNLSQLIEGLNEWGWCSLLLAGPDALRSNRVAADRLRDVCWATVAMSRLGGAARWKRRPAQPDLPAGTFALEVERARQPTPDGGQLAYEVALGAGLIPASDESGIDALPAPPVVSPRLPRVLLAASEAELFTPLAGLLGRTVETLVVTDGVEALSRAVSWAPQVIVAETNLPRLPGFSVARALRQGRYAMPVILVSRGKRRHSERVRAYLNGATDFAFFPFDLQDLVYRVRVSSQMRLHSFQGGVEEHMLEVLLSKAKTHILDVPTFLQALSFSLHSGSRFSSPVSLVTFRLHCDVPNRRPQRLWQALLDLLDQKVRNGDLICTPNDSDIAILLCHETRRGAASFVHRMFRLAERLRGVPAEEGVNWRIETSSQTMEILEQERLDMRALLSAAFAQPRLFLEPEAPAGAPEEVRRFGT